MVNITREDWNKKFNDAKAFMESKTSVKKILIEVGAQHPLIEGKYPNEEFAARLTFAKELYEKGIKNGNQVEIYIPGSRHKYKEVQDLYSLSIAGKSFLVGLGVPDEIIHGSDLNKYYKDRRGVYNAADECYVASRYFKENNFGHLFSVVSPVQSYRKALHYIWFGIVPMIYTVPLKNTYHNYIDEVYDAIPYVRDIDPSSQEEDSFFAKESRKKKMPIN